MKYHQTMPLYDAMFPFSATLVFKLSHLNSAFRQCSWNFPVVKSGAVTVAKSTPYVLFQCFSKSGPVNLSSTSGSSKFKKFISNSMVLA